MKYLFFISISLILVVSCNKEETSPSNPFGIDYSDYTNVDLADGFIMYQNYGGPRIDLTVDTAFLVELDSAGYFKMQYYFTGEDSLQLVLKNYTTDYNYHSHAEESQNMIVFSVFNTDTLEMESSALSLQPKVETNNLNTVLNLHTADDKGTFNGTVNNVVLIKSEETEVKDQ